MPNRVLVAGPGQVLEAVQRAMPEAVVVAATETSREAMRTADCVIVDQASVGSAETWRSFAENAPVIEIGTAGDTGDLDAERLRRAVRGAVLEHRGRELLGELNDAWAHDVRGALGVARLGLELLRAGGDPQKPVEKIDNGLVRLGWLLERLPSQVALALDLPIATSNAPSLFPSLESYVTHLRRTHPRRNVELSGGPWTSNTTSQVLVPFASGLVALAFKISSGHTALRLASDTVRELRVECECPERSPPWDAQQTLGAFELSHQGEAFSPYRLVEVARMALRSGVALTVELSERTFCGRVLLSDPPVAG
jgi:hypothetical protein